jgi:DNA repair protein RecN (Recombination protein N)
MLIELSIKDFAIIDSLNISFGPGLNIFTGETGAGKSIILDAISLVLGDRASNEIIRASAEEAHVEAMFDVAAYKGIDKVLSEAGIVHSENLVIKRVVQRAGRNKIYINGSLATLVTLTEVGRRLIDIYGQNEHQSLTRPEEHVEALDSFGGFQKERVEMAEAYRSYVAVRKELDDISRESKDVSERRDSLTFQLKEIAEASLKDEEDAEVQKELERLKNSEKIRSAATEAERAIYSEAGSISERLGFLIKNLKGAASFDDKLTGTVEALETGLYQLEDAAAFLRRYSESVETDASRLDELGARLDLLNRLKRKYGPALKDVIQKRLTLDTELSGLSGQEERAKELASLLASAKEKASALAEGLSKARKAAAAELEKKIEKELSDLGMKGAVFNAMMEPERSPDGTPRFNEKGADRVVFYISANPGEEVKPLARIASGGELSRIMLAMKSVTSVGRVPTLVFDEIDTGVGGAMAQVVGLKLKEVSKRHQVLCITHLPQIAAFADKHYSVTKKSSSGKTVTSVRELNGSEKVEEISSLLGGMKVTDVTRKHATELIEAAESLSATRGKATRKG